MKSRQTLPRRWLLVGTEPADEALRSVRRVPRGSGIILMGALPQGERRQLRTLARTRALTVADEEEGDARRVHDMRELRRAMLKRTSLILLSPIHRTGSHPEWSPLPRMRAASMARLGGRRLLALGGMNAKRFERIRRLGFVGWAGISAFRT